MRFLSALTLMFVISSSASAMSGLPVSQSFPKDGTFCG